MHKLFPQTWPWIQAVLLAQPQAEVFIVGGAVRDALLKKPLKDIDLVMRQVPMDVLMETLATLGDVHAVGKRFGVLKFKPAGESTWFDIALPRKEYSWSFTGGYRDFDIQSDHTLPLEVDLSRRDFTINAMAYNLATHTLIDPFFGQKDLKAGVIRTVGAATTRFQEDYSRMLRAVRFACRLQFKLSDATAKAIKRLGGHLDDTIGDDWVVAREVMAQEFLKAFDAAPVRCLSMLDELGLLEKLLPEVKALQSCAQTPPYHTEGSAYDHLVLALQTLETPEFHKRFPEGPTLMSKLAILFHDIGKPVSSSKKNSIIHFYGHEAKGATITQTICDRLKLGSTPFYPFDHQQLAWIVREHLFAIKHQEAPPAATVLEEYFFSDRHPGRALLHCMFADQQASVAARKEATDTPIDQLLNQLHKLAPKGILPPPLLSGDDVIECLAIQPGPKIAEILRFAREQQLQGTIHTKAEAQQLVTKTYA